MSDDTADRPVYVAAVPAGARSVQVSEYDMRWSDMDAFGHVNNATYFTYFEQVRIDWLRALGVDHELVLANVSCTFIKALTYPDRLTVKLHAGRAGRSSLDTFYEIFDSRGALCSVGHGTVVWFDHDRGCAVEIPAPVRQRLA
jgi:acyl-CoA thioester hydrolase